MNSGKKLHLKVVTPAVKPTGLSTIHESPKAIKKQKSTATPSRHSSLHVSHGIPNKPNPPSQSSSGSISPQDSVFKFPDQKTEPPPAEQQNNNRKAPLIKASTVSDVLQSKPQTSMPIKQFSEENIRPPSQFDSPARMSTSSPDVENLSPFAEALRKASKAREERILTNQPRMLTTTNKQEHDLPEEEDESIGITPQVQPGGNPITSSTTKQESKTDTTSVISEAKSINVIDSTDSQEMQQSKDSPQNDVSKLPISSLIKRFSGDYSDTQEAPGSTHTDVGKTYKNFDKQHPNQNMASTNTEKSKSVTMIAKTFEGEKADDGTYNWRGALKSVSKPPVVKSSTPNVEDESGESTNVCERTTNRQMQGTPVTKKTSKTSLLAKKFEQNAMVRSESIVTKKVEKTLQQNLSEASTEKVKQIPPSMAEQKSFPLVENSLKVISINENATSPLQKESNIENGALPVEKDSDALPVEQAAVSSTVKQLRRESAVVMYEEGKEGEISLKYERSSVLVDTDYWKSPEHATSISGTSEVSASNIRASQFPDESTVTEILPDPELDILPPPILSMDEELALSIEDLPLPEFLPPPEIDDFTEFQDLPPPPGDFPDSDFCQDTPSFDITVSNNTHNTDIFELPSPSQLPPHYDTDNFELPSPSQLPPQLPPHDDTDDFELPSPSQLSPHDDTDDFELPSPSQLSPHDDTDDFELPSPSQLPPHNDTDDFELPSPSQLPPHDDTDDFGLPSPSQLPPLQEGSSDRDDSSLVPDKESALENKKDEKTDDNEVLSKENLQYSPSSSTTALPSVKKTDSNSIPPHIFENNDITLQTPSSPSDLSDIPVHQDEEKVPSVNPDQQLSSVISDENHESLEDNLSQVCTSVCSIKINV